MCVCFCGRVSVMAIYVIVSFFSNNPTKKCICNLVFAATNWASRSYIVTVTSGNSILDKSVLSLEVYIEVEPSIVGIVRQQLKKFLPTVCDIQMRSNNRLNRQKKPRHIKVRMIQKQTKMKERILGTNFLYIITK